MIGKKKIIKDNLLIFILATVLLVPYEAYAQQKDSLKAAINIYGIIKDRLSGKPLPFANVGFIGSNYGTNTDSNGVYNLQAPKRFNQIRIFMVGYKEIILNLGPKPSQEINAQLVGTQKQLKEIMVTASRKTKYRNKNNPAVSLIQQIINHKNQNQMQHRDYLQYDQYERIEFSAIDMSKKFLASKFFRKYQFLLDTTKVIDEKKQTALPVYMSEKQYSYFYRNSPAKSISILQAHKEVDFSTFIDSAGLDIYLNRLYGNVDIYANNIFILTNQFLSPIADHAPSFYKYFITDTLQSGDHKILEVSFLPRNRGDLLFEGKLLITMDGNYAVEGVDLSVDKHINLNFLRSIHVHQDFQQHEDKRYYLYKSQVRSNFGPIKNKNVGLYGERTILLKNYRVNAPKPASFYNGANMQQAPNANHSDNAFWQSNRGDTLSPAQAKVYSHIDSLQRMPSFKNTLWITTLITGGYAVAGPVQYGPLGGLYTFNTLEGNRFSIGGRTTPLFNKTWYFEDYLAYGTKDKQFKGYSGVAYSFNHIAPYRFPNNYLKVSFRYDTDIPGQNFLIDKTQNFFSSFSRGAKNFWLYNQIIKLDYARDFANHFSFDLDIKSQTSRTAGTLLYQPMDITLPQVPQLNSTEIGLVMRYAPHEQIFQGTIHRHPIANKYPIYTLKLNYGLKGVFQSQYRYLNTSANIYRRFYLSQLGFTDVTLQAGAVFGQVPFPLLAILPANQSYVYDPNAYNMMNFLEFVTDRYAGFNVTHSFGGFFLNKVPLIRRLNLREFLSLKVIAGGLSNQK